MTPIDPQFSDRFHLLDGVTSWHDGDPATEERLRQYVEPFRQYRLPLVAIENLRIDGPHGSIPIRVYRAQATGAADEPALMWIHGGGFVEGDVDTAESHDVAATIVERTGFTVVTVDYRLAVGGVHFPVPHDDVLAAWQWLTTTSELAPRQAFIGGASAGASLAAGVTLRLRDEGSPMPAAALLVYPTLHAVVPAASAELSAKMSALPPLLRFPPVEILAMNVNYLGGPIDTAAAYAMPGLADLAGMPPVLVVTSEYDDLNPSGSRFAADLTAAGVEVQLREEAGVPHGHLNEPWTNGAQQTIAAMSTYLLAHRDAGSRRSDGGSG